MAGSGFPQRKSQGAGGMTSAGPNSAGVLDGPPPSPVMPQGPGGGGPQLTPGTPQAMPSFEEMAKPMTAGTPGRAVSPELLTGVMSSIQTVLGIYDSLASLIPDLANDFALQKDLLERTAGKLLVNGGPTGAGGSPGANFPGGGFLSGV